MTTFSDDVSNDDTLVGVTPLGQEVPIRHIPQADKLLDCWPDIVGWAENLLATRDQLERLVGDADRVQHAVNLITEWDDLLGDEREQWEAPAAFSSKQRSIMRKLVAMIGVRAASASVDVDHDTAVTLALKGGLDTEAVLRVSDALLECDVVNTTRLSQELGVNYSLVQSLAELMGVKRQMGRPRKS